MILTYFKPQVRVSSKGNDINKPGIHDDNKLIWDSQRALITLESTESLNSTGINGEHGKIYHSAIKNNLISSIHKD